jgi:putative tricarboxylic transport membrane protein
MGLALAFGILGYIARRTDYHVAAILIGIILGPLLEGFFLRAIRMANGDITVLFSSNLGNVLWAALVVTVALPYLLDYLRARRQQKPI